MEENVLCNRVAGTKNKINSASSKMDDILGQIRDKKVLLCGMDIERLMSLRDNMYAASKKSRDLQ